MEINPELFKRVHNHLKIFKLSRGHLSHLTILSHLIRKLAERMQRGCFDPGSQTYSINENYLSGE